MGLQLSRLERTPDKREVGSSSLLKPTKPDAIASGFLFIHSYQFSNSEGRKIRFGYLFVSKTKITTLRYKSTVSSNAKKGILAGKTRCIPKPKDEKGYIGGKNSLYTQIKRQERVYCRKKLAVYPKYNLNRKKYICSMLSSDSIGDIGENIYFPLRPRQNFIIESWGSRKLHDLQGKNAIRVME